MNTALTFGGWLKRRRGGLGLTQKELAQQVGYAEVTLRKVEADEMRPSRQMAEKLAEVLQIPSEDRGQFMRFARDESSWEDIGLPTQGPAANLSHPSTNVPSHSALPLSHEKAQLTVAGDLYNPLHTPTNTDSGDDLPRSQAHLDLAKAEWGEAPDVSSFYGRRTELAQLHQWLVDDRCRVVAVLGMGGLGKTALATKAATLVAENFDFIIWLSLRNAPPVEEVLGQSIQIAPIHQEHEFPSSIDKRIGLLLEHLQRQRCLLVLDNFETVLDRDRVGAYRPGYEGYGQLLQRVGEGRHQSCLLLTSREKPKELIALAGMTTPVRTLTVAGLPPVDCQALLRDRELTGSDADWLALHERYSGNPLALKIVSEAIRELFIGDIGGFLRTDTIVFGDIAELLAQQFARLSQLEQEVMLWLAVEREAVEPDELREDMVQPPPMRAVLEALHALRQRSLVERVETGFTLQNVVLEYLTVYLIEQICDELIGGQIRLFQRHALLKTQAKSYVQESQRTLILKPIANRLVDRKDRQWAIECLDALLATLRQTLPHQPSYAGGNLLNLLVYLNGHLRGQNFSHLAVWQANLRGVDAQDVDFCQSDLTRSSFTDTFAAIFAVSFSPDGKLLAAGTHAKEIRVWRVKDGLPLFTYKGHTDWVWSLCFSPDGQVLASSSDDQTVRLWEVYSGRCLATLRGHTGRVRGVCFSPDGYTLASASGDQTVCLWEMSSGRRLTTLQGHTDEARSVCFSPDGNMLVSGSFDRTVRLWDRQTGRCLDTLHGHTGPIASICFSPDGNMLASGSHDQTVRLWEMPSGRCIATLQGHTSDVRSVCFSPDGDRLATGSGDQTVRLWDRHMGHCLQMLQGHTDWIESVCFSSDGNMLASGGDDQTVRLWEMPWGRCLITLQGYTNNAIFSRFSPDGSILASMSFDPATHLWEAHSGQCIGMLPGYTNVVLEPSFSPDSSYLATSSQEHAVLLWEVRSGHCLAILRGHTSYVSRVCFSPDGNMLASSSRDGIVRLWRMSNGGRLAILRGHTDSVDSLCFSPDSSVVATGSYDGTVKLWDSHTGQYLRTLQGHTSDVRSVCFSPDGNRLATGSGDQTVRLWDKQTGQCLQTLQGHTGKVSFVCFSLDGSFLASASEDQTIRLWDRQTGRCLHVLQGCTSRQGHTNSIVFVRSSLDSSIVAGISNKRTVRLWDSHTGECLHTLQVDDGELLDVCFSSTGDALASSSEGDAIKIWKVQTGECLQVLRGYRPYERMNIAGVTGLTAIQIATLEALGAVENLTRCRDL